MNRFADQRIWGKRDRIKDSMHNFHGFTDLANAVDYGIL